MTYLLQNYNFGDLGDQCMPGTFFCDLAAQQLHATGVYTGKLALVRNDFAAACANGGCAVDPANPKRVFLTKYGPEGGNPPAGCVSSPKSDDKLNADGSVAQWGGCAAWDCQNAAPLAPSKNCPPSVINTSSCSCKVFQNCIQAEIVVLVLAVLFLLRKIRRKPKVDKG